MDSDVANYEKLLQKLLKMKGSNKLVDAAYERAVKKIDEYGSQGVLKRYDGKRFFNAILHGNRSREFVC